MAYPIFYPFKTRVYDASSTSTATTINLVVVARGKYLGGELAVTSSSTLSPVIDILQNGSGIVGSTGISAITSSTVTFQSAAIPLPTTVTYVSPGDVLGTSYSSAVGGMVVSHVIQEF